MACDLRKDEGLTPAAGLQEALRRLSRLLEQSSPPPETSTREMPGDGERSGRPPPRMAPQPAASGDETPDPALLPRTPALSDDQVLRLLNIASAPAATTHPSDRQLILDALAAAMETLTPAGIELLGERLCNMRSPPAFLAKAVFNRASGSMRARMLQTVRLSDHDLAALLSSCTSAELALVARRRHLGPRVCAWLGIHAAADVVHLMLMNDHARPDAEVWKILLDRAREESDVALAMHRRQDMPAAVAHELFWYVSGAARTHLLLRSGSPSAHVDFLLEHFRQQLPALNGAPLRELSVVWGALEEGNWTGAASALASRVRIGKASALRILRDRGGEPLIVLMKAAGARMRDIRQLLLMMQERPIARRWPFVHEEERLADLFARLQVRRARIAMLYWGWRTRNVGPYAAFPFRDDA